MEDLFEVVLVLAQQPLVVVELDHLFGEPPLGEPCLKGVQLLYYHGGFQKLGRYGGLAVLDHPCEPDLLLLGKKEHRAHLLEIGPHRVMDGAWTDLFGVLLREVGDDIGIHPGVLDIELRFLFLPWKDDLLVSVSLITNFFGLTRRYEEHATVDPETKGWYKGRKYCSFQKGLLLMDLAAMFVMALSGYALYWPGQFAWLYDLVRPWGGYFVIRGFHLLMFYYFVSTLVGHVYLSLIPMNWGKLRSIVFGKGKVHRHREPHAPGTVVTVLETVTEER